MEYQVLQFLAASLLISACSLERASEERPSELTGNAELALRVDILEDTDVSAIRFELTKVACDESARRLAATERVDQDLEEILIPGPLSSLRERPLATQSAHLFADRFLSLESGCYDIRVIPLSASGQPSVDCAAAFQQGVRVVGTETAELTLISQCRAGGSAALGGVAALNHPPEIVEIEDADAKPITTCEAEIVCATVVDPDLDPLDLQWTVGNMRSDTYTPQVLSSTSERRGELTQCIRFVASEPGAFFVALGAYDLLHRNGVRLRFEEWLEREGYPHDSHAEWAWLFEAEPGAETSCGG